MVEDDVSQQRTDDSSLGSANRGGLEHAIFHHASAKEFLNQTQDVAVGDLGRHCLHDDSVGKVIEKGLDVGIENDAIARSMEFEHLVQCLVAVASPAEAEGRVVKQPLEDRLEQAS